MKNIVGGWCTSVVFGDGKKLINLIDLNKYIILPLTLTG